MPRIRTIKPEFWADEKLSLLDPLTRLVFLGLISMADDAGRLVDNVKGIDGMLFPATDDSCAVPLGTLSSIGRILRYRSGSGQELLQIINWGAHQRVDHPSPYVLPGPETAVATRPVATSAVPSVDVDADSTTRETLARPSRSDLRPPTTDLRPSTDDQISTTARVLSIRANQGLAEHPDCPQPIPRIIATSARSHAAARSILEAGVDVGFAERTVYDLAKSHRADGEIRSLGYFVSAVQRAWDEHQAAESARAAPAPKTNGRRRSATPPGAPAPGRASLMFGRIRALVQVSQAPGQREVRFIPRAAVEALGADVAAAYDAIGGADRILTASGDKLGYLIRDFTNALEAASHELATSEAQP